MGCAACYSTSTFQAKVLQGQKSGRRLDSVGQQPTTCEPAGAVLAGSSDMQYMTAVWATGQYITGPSEAGGPCESVTYQQTSECTCCMRWGGASSRSQPGVGRLQPLTGCRSAKHAELAVCGCWSRGSVLQHAA